MCITCTKIYCYWSSVCDVVPQSYRGPLYFDSQYSYYYIQVSRPNLPLASTATEHVAPP